jgi:alkylation response protein AidB-like acyl-CoA dehydrogenase
MLDYKDDAEVVALRRTLHDLIATHIPRTYLGAFTRDPADLAVAENFSKVLGDERLLTPAWPVAYGGRASSYWEQAAFREEMWAMHEPRGAQYMGVNWVGPILMRHGDEQQIARHIPPISAGDVIWCQGFSEPGAGSDLPALRTSAAKVEGGWRINGQKTWTSYALMAQWCFLLARTGPAGGRKEGITVFLVNMDQPGVEVRSIATMLGHHHINDVFFDDVFVPDHEVLGAVGGGWDIAMDVITLERIGIARYARCERLLAEAPAALGGGWDEVPEALKARWAAARVHARQAKLLAYRVVSQQDAGTAVDAADVARYRIAVTNLDQETADVLVDLVGGWSFGTPDTDKVFIRAVEDHWRYAQASTVASGTLEIQKQTLAKVMVSA